MAANAQVVVSNDTDSHKPTSQYWSEPFLDRDWTREKRRLLSLHRKSERMDEPLCRVLVKAHVLSGNDVTSRIGTKRIAMQCNPIVYVTEFAE